MCRRKVVKRLSRRAKLVWIHGDQSQHANTQMDIDKGSHTVVLPDLKLPNLSIQINTRTDIDLGTDIQIHPPPTHTHPYPHTHPPTDIHPHKGTRRHTHSPYPHRHTHTHIPHRHTHTYRHTHTHIQADTKRPDRQTDSKRWTTGKVLEFSSCGKPKSLHRTDIW